VSLQCEFIVPEEFVPDHTEDVLDDMGDQVLNDQGEPARRLVGRTIPEHRCTDEATSMARRVHEEAVDPNDEDQGTEWIIDAEHVYCARHHQSETATDINGKVTWHAPMSADDYHVAEFGKESQHVGS
jgi:hypothetical protein